MAARSKVFENMFTHSNIKESINNELNMKDNHSPDVISIMIDLLYDDRDDLSFQDETCNELLELSDKYDIPYIRFLCERWMKIKLRPNNAAVTLLKAKKANAPNLAKAALQMVRVNAPSIICTEDFACLMKNYPTIMMKEEEEENMYRQLYVANEGFFANFSTISKNSANCFPRRFAK